MIQVERNYTNRSRGLSKQSIQFIYHKVLPVIDNLQEYWPLTLRQVYYRLVAAEIIENSLNEYKKLSTLLTKARLQRIVPWDSIEDRARDRLASAGWRDSNHFIDEEVEKFLQGYRRHLIQDQDIAPEIWVEKDALSRICHRAAYEYCVPVVVAKGFSSISYMNKCRERIQYYADREGKPTVILYFGDFDPSGWEMPEAMLETFHGDMGVDEEDLTMYRCALTEDQVHGLSLPHSPEALKHTDSRAAKFIDKFGRMAVELDAISPEDLEDLVADSIESILDMDRFEKQRDAQKKEAATIHELQSDVETQVAEWKEEHGFD